ncbi:MAG TPA: electron transfer flavoprotein subunit alpha/FixB family protein [Dehalococcoidales bacterium]|nr:electron transfer flavoprotein subunit alpha/FixB family protein [Dehalococcoidales bacterium]
MKSIIYVEPSEGKVDPNVKKIVARLRKIPAERRGLIKGITLSHNFKNREEELRELFDELVAVEVPEEYLYNTEVMANLLTDLLEADSPALLFLVFSHLGMELAPTAGMRLGVPTVTGCTDFNIEDGTAEVRRLVYGSKLTISLSVDISRGGVFSIQRGSLKETGAAGTAGAVRESSLSALPWDKKWAARKSKVLGLVAEEGGIPEQEDITKAPLLVSVGRGVGGPDNIPLIRTLTDCLKGTLSCSRPVVDNNWLPHHHQVGTSGKTVSPTIYLALGISGQGNHVAGMDTSRIIIAVNKDPGAPIFKIAHYGVVDDLFQIVPELIKQTEVGS